MMDLLVDIGNSRLKWALSENGRLQSGSPIVHREPDFAAQLDSAWRDIPRQPARMAISSVGSNSVLERVVENAKAVWPMIEIVIPQSEACRYGVENGYVYPERLGVDRWLCLIAAHHAFRSPVCIVDCGTALTVDVLDGNGKHRGGVICPGLSMMKHSLYHGTTNLALIDQHYSLGIAQTTESAIYSGTLYAATGLVMTILMQQEPTYDLVITGGDADLIARHIDRKATICPELIMKGLSIVLAGS
ncbi:MAG: pantothenate kinase [Methylomicrobium sp.]